MARADRPSPEDEPPWDGHSVDFLVGAEHDDADLDEELPQPKPAKARTRRLRTTLGIGAAGLIVVLLVARALSGPASTPRAVGSASPSVPETFAPGPPPTGPVTAPPYLYRGNLPPDPTTAANSRAPQPAFPRSIPRRHGADPTVCPGPHCTSSSTIPAPVTAAVQTALPESQLERVQTVRLNDGDLWFREVDARVGSQRLILRVQAPSKGDRTRSGRRTSHSVSTTFLETSLGPWHVEVDVLDLLGGQAPAGPLRELAADPRIVAG